VTLLFAPTSRLKDFSGMFLFPPIFALCLRKHFSPSFKLGPVGERPLQNGAKPTSTRARLNPIQPYCVAA